MTVSIQHARDILKQAELLYTHEQVQAALHKVAQQINAALADAHPLVLSVMGGAVVFSGQLLPLLDFPLDFDYVHVSRYGNARQGGAMHWKVGPRGEGGGGGVQRAVSAGARFSAGFRLRVCVALR